MSASIERVHVVSDTRARRHVMAAMGGEAQVTESASLVGAIQALERSGAAVLVLSADAGALDELALAALRAELGRRAPKMLLVMLTERDAEVGAVSTVGGGVLVGVDVALPAGLHQLREWVLSARRSARLHAVAIDMGRDIHQDVAFLVHYVVEHGFDTLTVEDVVRRVPVTGSKLRVRLRRHLGMTLQQLISWGRCMAGVAELESTMRTVEAIALSLGYEDASGFTKLCRGCCGRPPSVLLEEGGSVAVERAWRSAIVSSR